MHEIRRIFALFPPDCQPATIEPLGNAGGLSGAQFWRADTARGSLVLRRWPPEHPSPERLRFIHDVLRHAAERGVTVLPVPIRTQDGHSFVSQSGHLWEVAPWLPGAADYGATPTLEKLLAAMTTLARIHMAFSDYPITIPSPLQGHAAPARHIARLQKLTPSEIGNLSRAVTVDSWPQLALLAQHFLAALPATVPRAVEGLAPLATAHFKLQPCLRDIWHDHILFSGERVTGIIDCGAVDVDTPATDIARLLGSLVSYSPPRSGDGPGEGSITITNVWPAGLAAYTAIRPLTQEEHLAANALETSGTILAGCNWIRWIYIEKRGFENPAQILDRFCRIVRRL